MRAATTKEIQIITEEIVAQPADFESDLHKSFKLKSPNFI